METSAPATNWAEAVPPEENARFEALAAELRALQRDKATRQPKGRALHYKAIGGLRAEFRTLGNGPAWTRVGIFADANTYRAYARFSNGSPNGQPDPTPDVRGIGVKIVGVPGRKLIEGMRDAATQDFLAILSAATPFRSPEEFVGVVLAVNKSKLLAMPRLVSALGFGRLGPVLKKLKTGLETPIESVVSQKFYSALPIRWGDYAVKFRFVPTSIPDAGTTIDEKAPDRWSRDLSARLKRGPAEYDFQIQGFVDEKHTPIEDPTQLWEESVAPFVTVGHLTLLSQDTDSPTSKKCSDWINTLSFDPWHAPEEFRPLGAMMRARNHAYRESAIERGCAKEPDGSETWE